MTLIILEKLNCTSPMTSIDINVKGSLYNRIKSTAECVIDARLGNIDIIATRTDRVKSHQPPPQATKNVNNEIDIDPEEESPSEAILLSNLSGFTGLPFDPSTPTNKDDPIVHHLRTVQNLMPTIPKSPTQHDFMS
jgi:hypothetical protein